MTRGDLTLGVKTGKKEISRFPGKVGGEQNNNMGNIPDYSFKTFHGRKFTVCPKVGTYYLSLDSLILLEEFPALKSFLEKQSLPH